MNEVGEVIRVNGHNLRIVWSLRKSQASEPSWAWQNPAETGLGYALGAIWDRENNCWVLPK